MKKKATFIALCIAPPALLALALTLSLTVFRAGSPEETDGKTPTEEPVFTQPVKEREGKPPAPTPEEDTEGENPTNTETPTEAPGGKAPTGTIASETPALDDKTPIASPSLLTDETTGKGVISLGDSFERVKETLLKYELPTGDVMDISDNEGFIFFGDTRYLFNLSGYLMGYTSLCDETGVFETTKGLKVGDPVSKVFKLYGRDYRFEINWRSSTPAYIFSFEDTFIYILTENTSGTNPVEEDENATVWGIGCDIDLPYGGYEWED